MKRKHLAVIVLATLLTSAFVWVRLQIVSISYAINELTKQERQIRDECNSISLKVNQSKSPQRLERLASQKFHMQPPRPDQIIVLSKD